MVVLALSDLPSAKRSWGSMGRACMARGAPVPPPILKRNVISNI